MPEKYEEDRILVEGLPPEIDEDNLRMHLNDSDCILSIRSIDFTIVIQEDKSKAVINLDDNVAGNKYIDFIVNLQWISCELSLKLESL